jgi:hypothetical protein
MQITKIDSSRSRMILSRAAAREIFIARRNLGLESAHQASIRIAAKYHISSKAIRDIWKGRSWLDATFDLWNEEDRPARRVVGRPKGKKDSKPRAKRQAHTGQDSNRSDYLYKSSASRLSFTEDACGYFDECRLQQFHARRTSDPFHPSQSFSLGERIPNSTEASKGRTTCVLPSFGSIVHDMGLVPALPYQFTPQAASPQANLSFPKDCGSFPTPSVFGGSGAQCNLIALLASRLLCSRSVFAVSDAPFRLGAGLSVT